MNAVECQIHHVIEVSDDETYRECGECWHVFQTKADLQAACDALCDEAGWTRLDAEVVGSCPLCVHDW